MFDFMDETHFRIHSRGKSLRNRNLIKIYFNKINLLASGLRTIFHPEDPNELCDKLKLILQEKRVGNNSNIIFQENVV